MRAATRGPDLGAHPLRAGGADQRHVGAVDERLRAVHVGDHQLVQPLGRAAFGDGAVEQRGAGGRGQRRHRRGLPHHAVTAHQRYRGVPRPHRRREVEGRDHRHHAERMPGLHQPVAGPLRGHRAAVELAREPEREVADVDHLLDLAQRLGGDLAGLDRDQLAEVGLVLAEQLPEALDQRAPDGTPGPCARLEERRRAAAIAAWTSARAAAAGTSNSSSPVIGERAAMRVAGGGRQAERRSARGCGGPARAARRWRRRRGSAERWSSSSGVRCSNRMRG